MAKKTTANGKTQLKAVQYGYPDRTIERILLILIAITPIIVRLAKVSHASPIIHDSWLDTGDYGDLVTYYKFWILIVGTIVVLGVFTFKLYKEKFELLPNYLNLPLAIMFLGVTVSTIISPLKTVAVFGQFDQWEGALAYLCYFILFLMAANISISSNKVRLFLYALAPLIVVNLVLELLYFYGFEVIQWPIVQSLLMPESLAQGAQMLEVHLYSTIGNQDFISGIAGVCTSMFLFAAVLIRNRVQKWVYLIFSILSFALLLTSTATSGFLALVFTLPVLVYLTWRDEDRLEGIKTAATAISIFVLVFLTLNAHNHTVWDKTMGFFLGSNHSIESVLKSSSDASNTNVQTPVSSLNLPEFNLPASAWAPGTGRFYIWSKTLSLIKARPVFGYGLGTLAYFFPQDDPGKASGIWNPNTIVDKPHNLYLNFAYSCGLITLIAFVVLIIMYLYSHLRLFKGEVKGEKKALHISIFIGTYAYLIQALFNDSVIGTSLIFWIFAGVSVSLLRQDICE